MAFELTPDTVIALDIVQACGNSLAQAIVEDFMIFDIFPQAMEYGSKVSIALIKNAPALAEGLGKMAEGAGKGIKYTGQGIDEALPSLLKLLVTG